MHKRIRVFLTLIATTMLLGFIGVVFWWQDWQYSLPTPRPASVRQKPPGTLVSVPSAIRKRTTGLPKPLLLHFFNPECPCSRFNLDHLRMLIQKYRRSVDFVAVLQGDSNEKVVPAFESLELGIPGVADPAGRIAAEFGVYSTPQGVIIDPAGRLFYRGNYNTTRYCTNRQTEFARIALDAVLAGEEPATKIPAAAVVAYGCPLPSNRRSLLSQR